ncbi:membrane-associated proteins in eicosanoid and glutathione metabolism, partial [Vararia minispora EC-137]
SWLASSLVSVPILLLWQMSIVGRGRRASKIEYPRLYAEKAEQEANREAYVFNCKQRAHQNTLENIPSILILTGLTSVTSPKYAAAGLGIWVLGRVFYTLGYASGVPEKRYRGFLSYIGNLGERLSPDFM